jgi:ubiquinone/menaquinone biosynthesis C-methylase UbiE
MKKVDTSWGNVAGWYADHLKDPDSYHNKVILPNLLRIMDIKAGDTVLDLACGTGFFSQAFVNAGATVMGVDLGTELLKIAKQNVPTATFISSSAHDLSKTGIKDNSFDKIAIILAIQNIKQLKETISEAHRVLKKSGKLCIVMNHPVFRIPSNSSWQWSEGGRQFRRIDSYLSEKSSEIIMNPGSSAKQKTEKTISFHRSLQDYFKILTNTGFAVTRLEEWISNKKSEKGPRQQEEDRVRKEIPLFLFLECVPNFVGQANSK